MSKHTQERWLTLGEAAALAHISRPKLDRLIKEHQIPTKVNNRDKRERLVDVNTVLRILES